MEKEIQVEFLRTQNSWCNFGVRLNPEGSFEKLRAGMWALEIAQFWLLYLSAEFCTLRRRGVGDPHAAASSPSPSGSGSGSGGGGGGGGIFLQWHVSPRWQCLLHFTLQARGFFSRMYKATNFTGLSGLSQMHAHQFQKFCVRRTLIL